MSFLIIFCYSELWWPLSRNDVYKSLGREVWGKGTCGFLVLPSSRAIESSTLATWKPVTTRGLFSVSFPSFCFRYDFKMVDSLFSVKLNFRKKLFAYLSISEILWLFFIWLDGGKTLTYFNYDYTGDFQTVTFEGPDIRKMFYGSFHKVSEDLHVMYFNSIFW